MSGPENSVPEESSVLSFTLSTTANVTQWNTTDTDNNIPAPWKLFIMYAIVVLILLVNIPVFIIVPKRIPSLHKSMRYTMLSLAISDFLLGFRSLIRLLAFSVRRNYMITDGSIACKWDGFMNNLLASVSILCLTWLSVDKLLIVKYPFRHKEYITKKRIFFILLSIWFAMAVLYLPVLFAHTGDAHYVPCAYICIGAARNNLHAFSIVTLVHLLPSVAILASFISIYVLVKKGQKYRRKASTTTYNSTTMAQETDRDNTRMIKTLVIMSSGYYIMWVPFFVTVPYWEIFNNTSLHPYSDFFTCWLAAANSMVNPLIYIPTLKPYRDALFRLLRIKHKEVSQSGSGESRSVPLQYIKAEVTDPFSSNSG